MPPSPAMRCSPGREPRADNHKRGRSLESGRPIKQRDDDLALFNEVQSREHDNFLLQANDDFEDIFANKLRNFSDYKLGINIPARGESSDLLNAEEEKNDYEWLLTPPDTPLFRSLDDETPQVNIPQRGRPRTQPISISRSSTMEKSQRSSRGSASPNRISISPRSHNSTFENKSRAYSAPSASPPNTIRPTTTRSSPPPRKPLPRRLSTGSNNRGISGISPVKTTRGNSASPKVKAWQSNIPGFSTEVPPNLRTSLADRPASYVRGSSPASRSRQSMSPTASRSISSSHSHEDDVESFSSVIVGSSQRSNSRKVGGSQSNNKGLGLKKASRTVSSSSAPKRSFDLALRQMEHKKPQNMFRPLLSSVPSSTFHSGISNSPHHTMNSSVTTSSNASSGLGLSNAHDHEANHDDATSSYINVQDHDPDEEVFVIEKDDSLNDSRNLEKDDSLNNVSDVNIQKSLLICSKCGCGYSPVEENDENLCADCVRLTSVDQVTSVVETESTQSGQHVDLVTGDAKTQSGQHVDLVMTEVKTRSGQHVDLVKDGQSQSQSTYGEPIWNFLSGSSLSRSRSEECDPKQVSVDSVDYLKSKVDSLEGAGISILLKRSNSVKGAILRNTNFSASSISYDDFSYVRDSTNSMRSVSVSSSVDFGPVKQTDNARFQRQSSSTKSETENYQFAPNNGKHHRSGSSVSGTSSHAFHPPTTFENDIEKENENNIQTNFLKVEDVGPDDDTCALETCTIEEGTTPNPIDDVELQLDAISEGEIDQVSKCDVLSSSTSSIEESQEDVAVCAGDYDASNHVNNIIEESIVLVGLEGGSKGRSLTLEEATDTILFCSSIVHQLAHEAANIAIENENRLNHFDDENNGLWPLVPATRKSDLEKSDFQTRNLTKRSSKSQKSKQKKEVENDDSLSVNKLVAENDQPKTRIVGVRDSSNGESKKPPLLESKCNCAIM